LEMITSLDFPERRDLSTVLYPRVYLPDLSLGRSEREGRGQHARSRAPFERRCGRRARSPEASGAGKSGTRAHLMTIWRRLLMPSFCLPFFLDLGASAAAAGAAALALIVDGFYTAFLSV
jgi:hypothetical protein